MSARKLLRKDLTLELCLLLSSSMHSWRSCICFLCLNWFTNSFNIFGAFHKFALISNGSYDITKICSWVVQFLKIGTPKDLVRLSKKLTKAKFTVKYITKSVSELPHAASNSKRKFLSASTSQLHKILLFNNTIWVAGYIYQNVVVIWTHYLFVAGPVC